MIRINAQQLTACLPYAEVEGIADPAVLVTEGMVDLALLNPEPAMLRDWREALQALGGYGGPQRSTVLDSLHAADALYENLEVARFDPGFSIVSDFNPLLSEGGQEFAAEADAQLDADGLTFAQRLALWEAELADGLIDRPTMWERVEDFLFRHGSQVVGRNVWSLGWRGVRIEPLGANETPAFGAMAERPSEPEGTSFGEADDAYSGRPVRKLRTHTPTRPDWRIADRERMLAAQGAIADLLAEVEPVVTADGQPVLWTDQADTALTLVQAEAIDAHIATARALGETLREAREIPTTLIEERAFSRLA